MFMDNTNLAINQQILRLEVAVKHAMGVAVINTTNELVYVALDTICKRRICKSNQMREP